MGISLKGFGGGESAGSGTGASISGLSALPPQAADVRIPESAPVTPGDPYYANVVFHLPLQTDMNDTKSHAISTTGSPSITATFSPYAGGSSLNLNGSSYITALDNADYELGSGDFTIDMWARGTTVAGNRCFLGKSQDSNGISPYLMQLNASNQVQFLLDQDGAGPWEVNQLSSAVTVNTWFHTSIVRSGDTLYFFLNGTLITSTAYTGTLVNNANDIMIGALDFFGSGVSNYFTGQVADLRITAGVARYTTNFSVPTIAYPTS